MPKNFFRIFNSNEHTISSFEPPKLPELPLSESFIIFLIVFAFIVVVLLSVIIFKLKLKITWQNGRLKLKIGRGTGVTDGQTGVAGNFIYFFNKKNIFYNIFRYFS